MANSPQFKVYDAAGNYWAAVKEPEAAVLLTSFYGPGATVRAGHRKIVFTEGEDGTISENGYDEMAKLIYQRLKNQ
tara:strand:+ start:292 stop:519 length:228 start_codon:yes stop_codon:yes gene_type:complete